MAIRANRRSAIDFADPLSRSVGRLAPAISESRMVCDFEEGRVAFEELAADALDCRPDVRPIAIFPTPGTEAFMMQTIVDGSVGHAATDIRRQQMHDIVFTEREADVHLIPIRPAYARPQDQLAANQA